LVYKTKFLKQVVTEDYTPTADGTYTWDLTNEALAALWITVKGDVVAAGVDINGIMDAITGIDVWHGGFNVMHYAHSIDAVTMNCKLKGAEPYPVGSSQTIDEKVGVIFPLLFGAPYLNQQMALPASESNRKRLSLTVDIASTKLDALKLDIAEVLLPETKPIGCIKQEEIGVSAKGTGDQDLWLQTNWDLLKLNIRAPTVPTGSALTCTVNRAGLEINDFAFGYKWVPWEILHGELMDELEGNIGISGHIHADPSSGVTGMAYNIDTWRKYYAELDFFFNYDLKWAAPLHNASTAKLKYNAGVDEAFRIAVAEYVPASMLEY
jgi:hypothetical protein